MTLKLFADEFFKESFYFAPCLFHPNLQGVSKYFYSTKITFEKAKQVSQVVNNGQPWLTAVNSGPPWFKQLFIFTLCTK